MQPKKKKASKNMVIKRRWLKSKEGGNIDDYFKFDKDKDILGTGTYGSVMKAIDKRTKQVRAIKVIPKSRVSKEQRFKTEIEILRNLDHPNIIKLFETYEDDRKVYLVMEICDGGELFDRIIDSGHFSEEKARVCFCQMMKALNYIHSNKICHRDLKPENFLYMTKDENSPIKIIDFGLSKVFGEDVFEIDKQVRKELLAEGKRVKHKRKTRNKRTSMKTRAGTPYYIAPEVLEGDYDESCDIWSAGVILYIILCGYPPFYGNTDREILYRVQKMEFDFAGDEWNNVSQQAKNLIKKMICPSKQRISSMEVLMHPWCEQQNSHKELNNFNYKQLKQWKKLEKLKKIALTVIASQLNTSEIIELNEIFGELDRNGDGSLTVQEIKEGLKKSKKNTKDLQKVFDSIDTDKSGKIDYTEFIAVSMQKRVYLQEEKVYAAFKLFDKDSSGLISKEELKDVLGNDDDYKEKPQDFWENIIKEADLNKDGMIDYNEFLIMMQNIH